jgi:hypothetical protein
MLNARACVAARQYLTDPITVSGTFVLMRDDSGGFLYRLIEAIVIDK